jgi:hypothetical protein
VHWIQAKKLLEEDQPVIDVSIVVTTTGTLTSKPTI